MPDEMARTEIIKSVVIEAAPDAVWRALTEPDLMARWMFDDELEITLAPVVGAPFVIRGWLHGARFVNSGVVTRFSPGASFAYAYFSSSSSSVLEDRPENRTTVRFDLASTPAGAEILLTLSGFPHPSIPQHLDFYWGSTLRILKQRVEAGLGAA